MLFVIPPCVLSVDERHIHCAPSFRCGNQTDLHYPFWTPEREECGHPDFKVDCSGDFPEFSMFSVKFRILEMNYASRIIRLARMDYLNNLCPQHPDNAIINQQVFSLLQDTELQTFYYDCPVPRINFLPNGYISQLDCEDDIGVQSYFVWSPSHSRNRAILDASCERTVNIPVSRSALKRAESNHSLEALKKALDEGFNLRLNGDCSQCVRSRGACGYNQSLRDFVCYCINEPHAHTCHPEKKSCVTLCHLYPFDGAAGSLGAVMVLVVLIVIWYKRKTPNALTKQSLQALIPLKQYTYSEVKRITKSLAEVVGKGGFGTVYRGKLRDGRMVAVKLLKESKENGEDFINEVASMSKTSHVNIVSLLGFCYDGSKRAIIYEYVENGSLDQFFSSKVQSNKDWRTLYEIALGIARGLEYLHNGCQTRIVHFDIKPQNVLLDGNLCPKVSDFGLAKLCGKRESILSLLDTRGTIVDERHIHCAPSFRCGNQTDLHYPFWTPEREECGHPDFKVDCSGDFPEFSMFSVKFRILEMNYASRIIRLARMDYLNNLCPQHPDNAIINQQVFSLLQDTELQTFYYDCPVPRINFLPNGYISQLDCEDDIGVQSYFVWSPSHSRNRAILDASCERTVNIPVSRSALKRAESNHSLEALKKALDEGFNLRLNGDCSQCVRSRGACGYNQSLRDFVCYCINEPHAHTCHPEKKSCVTLCHLYPFDGAAVAGSLGAVMVLVVLIVIWYKRKTPNALTKQSLQALIPLKQYTYSEVKRITKSLAEVVGKGGFGTVYRGKLRDGRMVAVKLLKESKENGEDFINEVASMSKTSHVNIVSLLGFCYDGSKRAIIYEYVENGSLDQFFSSKVQSNKDWRTLYEIALGIARGLEYLHNGCQTRIVHFDIKPQNVLLDGNLCPKVSDFGLAKLCGKRESILSLLDTRGTIGYIAPEVFSRIYGNVSHKSDVYSYGMLIIEMIGARNTEASQNSESTTSSMYFPEWIYKDLENGNYRKRLGEEITVEEENIVKKMTLVGLWCIQSSPSNRPPMNRVIEMLEGSVQDLQVPPNPVLHLSATQFTESSWLSEENSGYSEV
ncbi:unnamed protein product [Arabis nemorensis]|uniref:non-specific serine/threonine protein kinase n=1 Tax=Arabis nemorensis TaxID=586526 RepID=A0A565C665_9BRAS|nr:unnamed protein product [Arabis nemorensis]